jgi:hypothetical protein
MMLESSDYGVMLPLHRLVRQLAAPGAHTPLRARDRRPSGFEFACDRGTGSVFESNDYGAREGWLGQWMKRAIEVVIVLAQTLKMDSGSRRETHKFSWLCLTPIDCTLLLLSRV